MSDKKDECSGYIRGAGRCRHGFPQNGGCWSAEMAASAVCLNEEVCGRFFDHNGGKPTQREQTKP